MPARALNSLANPTRSAPRAATTVAPRGDAEAMR
jgi:hypothetical protein